MKTVFGLCLIVVSSVCFGGDSKQDPLVAVVRGRFEAAGIPTIQNLQLGRAWICKVYAARTNDFGSGSKTYTFKPSDFEEIVTDASGKEITDYVLTADAVWGRYKYEYDDRNYVRVDANGNLLIETTMIRFAQPSGYRAAGDTAISIPKNTDYVAAYYTYCPNK